MKPVFLFGLSLSLTTMPLATSSCAAPSALEPARPYVSAQVLPDQRVTFRLRAPNAKEVTLALEGAPAAAMTRDTEGLWSVTTAPLPPDFYGYSFVADGSGVIDPANALLKPSLLSTQNLVHVRGPASLPWEVNDVPRGALHHHFYRSAVVDDERDFYVYTPPGYDASAKSGYPVLYLLHGFSDDASGWSAVGRAHILLDNLIAEGKARPMIIVMPLGYGAPEILAGGFAGFGKDRALLQRNFDRFSEALLTEVRPRVEASYRVAGDREARAIAGLSMGGSEALLTGLSHVDDFAWIGSFSAGGLTDDLAELPRLDHDASARLRLLWLACGSSDHLIDINRKLHGWLQAKGIQHAFVETPGAHTWMVWRRNLVAFASQLFGGPSANATAGAAAP